jgi:glutamate N-acetyltransferase/amino-acid N-acetyltransferase
MPRNRPMRGKRPARAIMTTDTFPKAATREVSIGGKKVTINGIAKGSGMIAPDMATMLAFVFTDAKIAAPLLQQMLQQSNAKKFQQHHGGWGHLDQ